MDALYIRKPYERQRLITVVEGESATDQSFGNDTDVNRIVARFARTGILPDANSAQAQYCDVTNLQADLTELIEKGREAMDELNRVKAENAAKMAEKAKEDAKLAAEYRNYKEKMAETLAPKPEENQ